MCFITWNIFRSVFQEATSQDQARRLQRQLRDLKENYTALQQKETEVNAKKNEYEKKLELGKTKKIRQNFANSFLPKLKYLI